MKFVVSAAALSLAFSCPAVAQIADARQPADRAVGGELSVINFVNAIEAAQAEIDGGVLEAELEIDDDILVYEVDLVQGETVSEVTVNAQTGEIISSREQTLTGIWSNWFQEDELQAAHSFRGTLTQAVIAVGQQVGGRITELSLEEENGRWLYEIEIRDAQGEREITVDAETGEVVILDD